MLFLKTIIPSSLTFFLQHKLRCAFIWPQQETSKDVMFYHTADQLMILIVYAIITAYYRFVIFVPA